MVPYGGGAQRFDGRVGSREPREEIGAKSQGDEDAAW